MGTPTQTLAEYAAEWLTVITWANNPCGNFIQQIAVSLHGVSHIAWENGAAEPLPPTEEPVNSTPAQMLDDGPFTDAWHAIASTPYLLEGEWVHPGDTIIHDPVALHEGARIGIACAPLGSTTHSPHYDPNRAAWATDMGVISFPTHSPDVVDQMLDAQQTDSGRILGAVALTGVAAAALHEALEQYAHSDSGSNLNPHRHEFRATIVFADGTQIETSI